MKTIVADVMRCLAPMFLALSMASFDAQAQPSVYPPGTFSMDGIPVQCNAYPVVLTTSISDAAMFNGSAILLNPAVMSPMPTMLKLYVFAHECGHAMIGLNEMAADCYAVKTGRNQGWFPPAGFTLLYNLFSTNPGDMSHPSGPTRLANMAACYAAP